MLLIDWIHRDQLYEFSLHVEQHYFDDGLDNHINNIETVSIDDHLINEYYEQSNKTCFHF
jgi:hypothetical protein